MEEETELPDFLRHHHCTTFIHAALPQQPMRNLERLHEMLSVGTMYLLNLLAAARLSHLMLMSTTEVYGAQPTNPNYLPEDAPRRAGRGNPFLRDKIDVEEQFERLAQQHPDTVVTTVRTCAILGSASRNWVTRFLGQRVVPVAAGYDPLIQFVHENDVTRAVLDMMVHPAAGAFNIVGDGVMRLTRAIAMAGKTALPLPAPILYVAANMLWQASVSPVPSSSLDFLKYGCVADGAKARTELGFEPVYNAEEALMTFLDAHRIEE
jgi:UDP-glucose 4-epimerase